MEIRPAGSGDVEGIERVARAAWYEAHVPIAGEAAVEEFLAEYYTADRLRETVEDPERTLVVAVETTVVGFAQVVPVPDEPEVFALSRIYVDPDRWGEGIGSRLLERAEAAAVDHGGSRLRLGVMAANDRAVAFYESRGFERIDTDYDERLGVQRYTYAKDL